MKDRGVEEEGVVNTGNQVMVASLSAWLLWLIGAGIVLKFGGNSHTFYSRATARGFLEETFRIGSDVSKAHQCFGRHHNLISPDLRVSIQAWINDGWKGWTKEKPSWFNERFMQQCAYLGFVMPVGGAVLRVEGRRRSSFSIIHEEFSKEVRRNSQRLALKDDDEDGGEVTL
jgi:hypothetical protein